MWSYWLLAACDKGRDPFLVLRTIRRADAVEFQDIAQGHDAFQLVHIRAIHNR